MSLVFMWSFSTIGRFKFKKFKKVTILNYQTSEETIIKTNDILWRTKELKDIDIKDH